LTRARTAGFGMLGLGYFLWYIPYSGLAKATTSGPVGGLVPADRDYKSYVDSARRLLAAVRWRIGVQRGSAVASGG
jgi:hypothetical protein